MQLLDRYRAGESFLHRLDPRVKLVITLAFIVSNVALPDGSWAGFGLAWLWLVSLCYAGGIGYRYVLLRSFIVLPFTLAAITSIFAIPGEPLFVLGIGNARLVATDAGVLRFVSVLVRSWLAVQMVLLLTAVTSFPDLMHGLRHLYVPAPLVAIISFMYRYLFVLSEETTRLLRAREARSAQLPGGTYKTGGSLLWRARVTGSIAGQLFLRSYDRSSRIYQAMVARGYQGRFLTLNPHVMRPVDWTVLGLAAATFLLIQLAGRLPLG